MASNLDLKRSRKAQNRCALTGAAAVALRMSLLRMDLFGRS